LASVKSVAQECNCVKDSTLKDVVDCKPYIFDNSATLYWSFNCDSSWLTYKNKSKEEILFSMAFVGYTERLGYSFAFEYDSTFLIRNEVISGCCDPAEFIIFDKYTGTLIRNLGRILYYSKDKLLPFIISVTNSKYDFKESYPYNSLSIINIENGKEYLVTMPKGEIEKAQKNAGKIFPEHLFDEPEVKGSIVNLVYNTDKKRSKESKRFILIDLKKYK
jgi:hypothetical protein